MEMQRFRFRSQLDALQPVELGLTAPGLLGLDAGLILADIFFGLADMVLLFLVGPFQCLALLRPLDDVPGIIALVFGHLAVFQLQYARRHLVQEIAVVGHDEDAAAIGQQVAFQPFQHVHVQMVRRFVEE